MKSVTPYLHFDGNCRQAMSFYQKCLATELQIMPMPDETGQPSSAPDARVMHSQLQYGATPILMATDGRPGSAPKAGNFMVCIDCDSTGEIERLFAALSEGGQIGLPLCDQPWGGRFGMLTDQFGIEWMLNCQLSPSTKITVETNIAAPIAEVWRAWTTPEDIVQWNAASDDWHTTKADVDLRVGGTFSSRMEAKDGSMGFDFAGTYKRVVDQRLLECSFGDRMLLVEFVPGPDGVTVRETFDAESTYTLEQQRDGWQSILDNFARHVQKSKA